ncbi:MAG: hypothetical protein IID61_06585 [SAR324 cluster bacterium]|nr:hypothetical protein [SAR324 cluster bacterium]
MRVTDYRILYTVDNLQYVVSVFRFRHREDDTGNLAKRIRCGRQVSPPSSPDRFQVNISTDCQRHSHSSSK